MVSTGDPVTDTKVNITKPRINLGNAVEIENIYSAYGPHIYVEDGCTLNGEVIYGFDPETFTWSPNANNIEEDPNFVGDYYLSQTDAGQSQQSPCVDAGSTDAANVCFGDFCLDDYTTRTDSEPDQGIVDMGYHHPLVPIAKELEPCSYCDLVRNGIVDLEDFAIFALYWLDVCIAEPWCSGLTSDYIIGFEDFIFFSECWLAWDNQGPEPDPSTWEVEPYSNAPTSIAMTAATAFDLWGWGVEYYFDEISGSSGGNDSTWQTNASYTDIGLSPNIQYTYRVRTRDMSPFQNMSAWSTESSVTTPGEDTTPPSPVGWAIVPHATGTTTIAMTAQTATDPEGNDPVQYYFEETTGSPGGNDSSWQTSSYTDAGLSPDTQYCYRVKVRDSSPNWNESDWSTPPACATTPPTVSLPPYPSTGVVGDRAKWDPQESGGFTGEPHEWPDGQGG